MLEVMTAAEVSKVTRIPVSTLKDWRANRRRGDKHSELGPEFYELGRRVLYRRDWVLEWLEARKR